MGTLNKYQSARQAGLNHEWATKVALREISLEEALGDMDMDDESKDDGGVYHGGIHYCNDECYEFGGCSECIPFW